MTNQKTNDLSLKISTSAIETTAPADIAAAGLGLALGATFDVIFFPGGLGPDDVATFASSGLVGLLYAGRAMHEWLAPGLAKRQSEAKAAAEAEVIARFRDQLRDLQVKARAQLNPSKPHDFSSEKNRRRFDKISEKLRTILDAGIIPSEEDEKNISIFESELQSILDCERNERNKRERRRTVVPPDLDLV